MEKYSRSGRDANRFALDTDDLIRELEGQSPDCIWPGCRYPQLEPETPICFRHTIYVSRRYDAILAEHANENPSRPDPTPLVYYLMIGPATVKIGTTKNLVSRIKSLRSELQYVVALERGGHDLERMRHAEFAAERIGRREDFKLSDRLTKHIEQLQGHRDELMVLAQVEGRKQS